MTHDVIHKYTLNPTEEDCTILMPESAQVISVQCQRNSLVLWAKHRLNAETPELRTFKMALTGKPTKIPINARFLGTVQMYDGSYVVHVYEL